MSVIAVIRPGGSSNADKTLHSWGQDAVNTVNGSRHAPVNDVDGGNATRAAAENALQSADLFVFFGHGEDDQLEDPSQNPLIDATNVGNAAGVGGVPSTIMVAIACNSAAQLGNDAYSAGADAYIGFERQLGWVTTAGNSMEKRLRDLVRILVEDLVISGNTVEDSKIEFQKSLADMIDYFDKDPQGQNEPDAYYAKLWSNWNKSYCTIIGDLQAAI